MGFVQVEDYQIAIPSTPTLKEIQMHWLNEGFHSGGYFLRNALKCKKKKM